MLDWLPPDTELIREVSAADWIVYQLQPWDPKGVRLNSFLPAGYEAYARVFHPVRYRPVGADPQVPDAAMSWAALGAERGVALSPDVAFSDVTGVGPEDEHLLSEISPRDGLLPPAECEALAMILRSHTATPETCWFCLWEGNGAYWSTSHSPLYPEGTPASQVQRYRERGRAQDQFLEAMPRVKAEHRNHFLLRGPLEAAWVFEPDGWYLSPNLWWPNDRSWVVQTEIDGFSTYLGGTIAAIEGVVASPELEAIRVSLDVRMDPGLHRPDPPAK